MAFAGGAADKVGSEYETWWTLRRLVQVLRGELDAMAVEPLSAEGAELWVQRDQTRTYDQVKFRSAGQWTPARLRNEGVLRKLVSHYASGAKVVLVLSQPSEHLEQLIGLACATYSRAEFEDQLDNLEGFQILVAAWGGTPEDAWTYLRQTTVRHDGLDSMKEFVHLALEHLLLGDINLAIGSLRRFLDDSITTIITAPKVWKVLSDVGIGSQPRWNEGPAAAQLRVAVEAYVRAVGASAPTAGTISRQESRAVVDAINDSVAPVILISGRAGAGKSVVVADVISELSSSGRHVAPIRLDRVDPSCSTAKQLGAVLELGSSPVSVLSDLSPSGLEGVLVIDQLDAVSAYSGRMPAVFDAVNEALNQARVLGNVRVVLAVRDVDLREDPRLRKLAGENAPTIEVGELDDADVKAYLIKCGFDHDVLDATTLRLLRLPIHLFVFTGLDDESRRAAYTTLTSLYAAFVRSARRKLALEGHGDHWPAVTTALVSRMNADEALAVPESVLENAPIDYVDAVISSGVVIKLSGRLALFHETFFDYLFASTFQHRGGLLVEWFVETGQGLFRRSQLRQLLAYIAASDRGTFIDEFVAIAESTLRPHLVSIAYSVLGELHPEPNDWIRIRPLLRSDNPFASRILALAGGPRWFAAIDSTGDVERLLDAPEWGNDLASLVARLSSEFPDRVLELLSKRQGLGDQWIEALRTAIEIADSPVWADYVVSHIASSGLDLPAAPFDPLNGLLLQNLLEHQPRDAIRLLAAALDKEINSVVAEGQSSVQGVFDEQRHHLLDGADLEKLARADGAFFVESLLPVIVKAASYKPETGSRMWEWRLPGGHRELGDELFFQFDQTLTELAKHDPENARVALDRLRVQEIDSLNFLVCRALGVGDAEIAARWLLESQEHLKVGWNSNPRWETRHLIERTSGGCSDESFEALEAILVHRDLDHLLSPPVAPALFLEWQGRSELELLSAMSVQRLSDGGRRRLAELHRKFPDWSPGEPKGMSGGTVHSPISRTACERMTDIQWMRAIDQYRHHERATFRGGEAYGGTHELAAMMGSVAKEQPERFLAVALSFADTVPAAYTDHVIRSLSSVVPQEELLPLLQKFRRDHPNESGKAVVSAIDSYTSQASDELFAELLLLIDDDDPQRELARTQSGSSEFFGGDFVSAGLNSTRGSVAGVLARILYKDKSRLESSLSGLQKLSNDRFVAVRAMAIEPALAYALIDRASGLNLIEVLLSDDDVLGTNLGLHALRWAMLWDANRFSSCLERALGGASAKDAGAIWANCFVNGSLGSTKREVADLSDTARIGVARAFRSNPGLAIDLMSELFADTNFEVRKEAAMALRSLNELDARTREELVARFATSSAFLENTDKLLDALEGIKGSLPIGTLKICQQIVDHLSASPPTHFSVITRNLVAVLVRLYRASSTVDRETTLDLIDQTVLMQIWPVEQALDEAR